jgi:hypothetical protein
MSVGSSQPTSTMTLDEHLSFLTVIRQVELAAALDAPDALAPPSQRR